MPPDTLPAAGFTVPELCLRWRIGQDKVRALIRRGELYGINVASDPSGRPLWRVTPESVALFERKRSSSPTPKRKRKRKVAGFTDYYPDAARKGVRR